MMFWLVFAAVAWAVGWGVNVWLSRLAVARWTGIAAPLVFGITLLSVWEGLVRGFEINQVSVSYTHLTLPTSDLV